MAESLEVIAKRFDRVPYLRTSVLAFTSAMSARAATLACCSAFLDHSHLPRVPILSDTTPFTFTFADKFLEARVSLPTTFHSSPEHSPFMLSIRHLSPRILTGNPLKSRIPQRSFHLTTVNMVKAGDSIPSIELFETTPATKVDLSKELTGKGLIIGVPAAFSLYIFEIIGTGN